MYYLFIILLTAHVFTDYLFQNDRMVEQKRNGNKFAIFSHSGLYTIVSVFLILPWLSFDKILGIIIISLLHGFIDILKTWILNKTKRIQFEVEVLDQIIHIFTIWVVVIILARNMSIGESQLKFLSFINHPYYFLFLIYMSAVVFLTRGANIFIKLLFEKVKKAKNKKIDKTGRLIGNLERLLIFIMILSNQWAAIGFIITAKSIARFENIKEKKQFAEYYIIGTLSSTLIAILTGMFVLFLSKSII